MSNKIKLTNEKKEKMINDIKNYFLEERDEKLGDLAAMMILDFIIDQIAPEFYNQGVFDSHLYMLERSEDLLSIQKSIK